MSWVGNREPEVAVEDEDFARAMERRDEEALRRATEIVLLDPLSAHPPSDQQLYARRSQMRAVFKLASGCGVHYLAECGGLPSSSSAVCSFSGSIGLTR